MDTIQAQPVAGDALDGAIETAASRLADSLVAGLTKKRCALLVCLMLWAIWLPAHIILNGL
jgi:hypothetical protein